jgi:hypothetical protein
VPRSSARQRRRPSPRSNPGHRRRHTPQRSRSRQTGRTATTISSSSPICTSCTTTRCKPNSRAHTLVARTSHPARFQSSRSRNPRRGAACALDQGLTSPTGTAGAPFSCLTPSEANLSIDWSVNTSSSQGSGGHSKTRQPHARFDVVLASVRLCRGRLCSWAQAADAVSCPGLRPSAGG